jgi:hypothetical protein
MRARVLILQQFFQQRSCDFSIDYLLEEFLMGFIMLFFGSGSSQLFL